MSSLGVASLVMVGLGVARQARFGSFRRGLVRSGVAVVVRRGGVRQVKVR